MDSVDHEAFDRQDETLESILGGSNGGKRRHRVSAGRDLGVVEAKEWIRLELVAQTPRHGELAFTAHRDGFLKGPLDIGVVRLDRLGETEIVHRVLVAAPDLGVGGQRSELGQRLRHHFHGALEYAPAPGDEERISTEEVAIRDICDRAEGVPWNLEDFDRDSAKLEGIPLR